MKTLHSLSDINMATVILCGGKSSRLNGEDKALLKYNFNKTFIEKIVEECGRKVFISVSNKNQSLSLLYNYNNIDFIEIDYKRDVQLIIETNEY